MTLHSCRPGPLVHGPDGLQSPLWVTVQGTQEPGSWSLPSVPGTTGAEVEGAALWALECCPLPTGRCGEASNPLPDLQDKTTVQESSLSSLKALKVCLPHTPSYVGPAPASLLCGEFGITRLPEENEEGDEVGAPARRPWAHL